MISIITQDPLFRLVEEVNETTVLVEGQEARALIDSGSQLSSISLVWVKKLHLKPQQLQSLLQIEGLGGIVSGLCGDSPWNTRNEGF